MVFSIYPLLEYRKDYNGLKELGLFLKEHTEEDAIIITNEDARFIEYYGHRKTISPPISDKTDVHLNWLRDVVKNTKDNPYYFFEVRMFGISALPGYDIERYGGAIQKMIRKVANVQEIGSIELELFQDPVLRFQKVTYHIMKMEPKPEFLATA